MNRDEEWLERWVRRSNDEIAAAWIDYESRPHPETEEAFDDPDWWAVEAMMSLSGDDPLRVLEVCFVIAKATGDPRVLVMLGAGPLETLLSDDPTLFDAVAHEARSTPALVEALRHVWQSTIPDDVWRRMQHLVGAT